MLIRPGFWSSSKGMVLVPDIVGLSTTAAQAAITAAGLANSGNTTEGTSDSNLGDKIKTQDPASGTKVQYESNVSYVSYVYNAAPSFPPSFPPNFEPPPPPNFEPPSFPTNRLCTQMNVDFGQGCSVGQCVSYGYGALC